MEVEVTGVRVLEVDVGRVRGMAERMGVGFGVRENIPRIW